MKSYLLNNQIFNKLINTNIATMTKLLITIIIIISVVLANLTYSQEKIEIDTVKLQCIYMLKYKEDSTNISNIRQEPMILYIGNNTSKFLSYNHILREEATKNIRFEIDSQSFSEFMRIQEQAAKTPRFLFFIYKNYPDGQISYIEYVLPSLYLYAEPMSLMKWEISNQTKKVFGFVVQKATTEFGGRKWEAWFAPEIPISEGPYKFNGLPGLIVNIADTKGHYSFELTSLDVPDEVLPIYYGNNSTIIKTTKNNFFKAQNDFRDNILNATMTAGMSIENQQRAVANMKAKNNPIELIFD